MQYDDLLRRLGEFGRYQRYQYLLVCLVAVTSSFHSMNMVFVGPTPEHRCAVQDVPAQWENLTTDQRSRLTYPLTAKGKTDRCKMYKINETDWNQGNYTSWVDDNTRNTTSCTNGWVYDRDEYKSTIVSEWNLVCDDAWQRSLASTIFFAGRFAGAFVGQLSDRVGRRPVFFVSVVLQAVVGCVAALSPTLWFFYIFYFLQGALQVSVYLSSYVLGTELVGPSYRKLAGMSSNFFYAIGQMILALMAFGIRQWRWIEIGISLPPLLFISYYWLMSESIRWLLTVGRKEEAAKILQKVSKMNKVPLEDDIVYKIETGTASGEVPKKYTLIDILKRWKLARISLNIWFNWLANALVYYGLSLNTSNLAGDPYLNFFISACVEIPSLLLAILLLDRIGRKRLYILFLVVAAAGCFSTAFVPARLQWLATTLSMVGKFGITGSYAVIYLMAAELFPTVVRNIGVGMSSAFSRVGGMVAPQVVLLGTIAAPLPQVTFAAVAVVAAVTGVFLPETASLHLPNDLDDMAAVHRNPVAVDQNPNDMEKSNASQAEKSETTEL